MEKSTVLFITSDSSDLEIAEVGDVLPFRWIFTEREQKKLDKNLAEYCYTNKIVYLNSTAKELNFRVLALVEVMSFSQKFVWIMV